MKDFLKSQLEEIRQNKLRIGLLTIIFLGTIIFATSNFDNGEEIQLDEPKKNLPATENLPAKNISVTSEKVKAVIGANVEEIYIHDPFYNPATTVKKVEEVPVKVEEKVLPTVKPVIVPQPVKEVPKPPEEKFILKATALGEIKTALIEKIVEDKSETLFLKIGDKVGDKTISEIENDFIKFDDDSIMMIEKLVPTTPRTAPNKE